MIRRLALLPLLVAFLTLLACSSGGSNEGPTPQPGESRYGYIQTRNAELRDVVVGAGSKKVIAFNDGSLLMDPALSPDGRRIAFVRQEPAKNVTNGSIDFGSDLYVVNRDGSGLKEIVHHGDLAEYVREPSWLNSDELLFSVRGRTADASADYRIERFDLRNGQRARVVAMAVEPSVGPNRSTMAYVTVETATQKEGIVLANVDGSGGHTILPELPILTLIGSAVLSPDEKQIAFAAGDLLGSVASPRRRMPLLHPFFQDVWVINVDGTGLRRVAEVVESSLSISWSPDGRWLYAMGATSFRRIDPSTGEILLLGDGSPQGGIFLYEVR